MTHQRRKPTLSDRIASAVGEAASLGTLPDGTVVTEKALAGIFSASRTPVRTALRALVADGRLRALPEGGYVTAAGEGPAGPAGRLPVVSAEMLGISGADAQRGASGSGQSIETDFERALLDALPFGRFWINETEAADHYAVSRTIIRELLIKFEDRMLVQKNARSHWTVGPLTAGMIDSHYEIRGQLEPLALRQALAHAEARTLEDMIGRLDRLGAEDDPAPSALAEIERDLHVTLLGKGPNHILLRMVRCVQVPLSVNALIREGAGPRSGRSALVEHRMILDLSRRGAVDAACSALQAHIAFGAERMRQRLKRIPALPTPEIPAYLKEMRG